MFPFNIIMVYHHLKLEIESEIPAENERKMYLNNLAWPKLMV